MLQWSRAPSSVMRGGVLPLMPTVLIASFHLAGPLLGDTFLWMQKKLGAKRRSLLERPEAPSAIKGKVPQSFEFAHPPPFFLHLRTSTFSSQSASRDSFRSFHISSCSAIRRHIARTRGYVRDVLLSVRNFSRIVVPWKSAWYVSVTIHHL